MSILNNISARARITYWLHLYKACFKQHHKNLIPFFQNIIPVDGVVIEAGAHAGQFTKLFCQIASEGHVYAVEPNSYAFDILGRSMKVNRFRNVTIEQCGFSDTQGDLVLSMPVKKSGSYGFGLSHFGPVNQADNGVYVDERVPVTTVDKFASVKGLSRVDFLKADIAGWEMRFILGASQVIDSYRPAILLELEDHRLSYAGDTSADIWSFLSERGYKGYSMSDTIEEYPYGRKDADVLFLAD